MPTNEEISWVLYGMNRIRVQIGKKLSTFEGVKNKLQCFRKSLLLPGAIVHSIQDGEEDSASNSDEYVGCLTSLLLA